MENKKPCSKPPTKTGRFMTPLTQGSPALDGKDSYLKKNGVVAGRLLRKGYGHWSPHGIFMILDLIPPILLLKSPKKVTASLEVGQSSMCDSSGWTHVPGEAIQLAFVAKKRIN